MAQFIVESFGFFFLFGEEEKKQEEGIMRLLVGLVRKMAMKKLVW
jgi:hypothetical protein